MNERVIEVSAQVEAEQAKFAALLEEHPEAQAIAMAYIAGMESALAKVEVCNRIIAELDEQLNGLVPDHTKED